MRLLRDGEASFYILVSTFIRVSAPNSVLVVPAVHHDGSGVRGVHLLHPLEELEHADGRERNTEVRPAGEVQLSDQTGCFGSVTGLLRWTQGG